MKRMYMICISMMLLLTACASTEADSTAEASMLSNLPEKLSVDFDLDSVRVPETVCSYYAQPLTLDPETVCATLLKGKIETEIVYAEGPQYVTSYDDKMEYLSAAGLRRPRRYSGQ